MRCFTEEYTTSVKIIEIEIIIKVFMSYIVFVLYLCRDVRFKYFYYTQFNYDKGCNDFCHFYPVCREASRFFVSVSDSERQHFGIALCDVVCLHLLDGVEGEDSGLVCLCHVLAVQCV